MFESICEVLPDCDPEVLEHTVQLAVEIAREGREGRKIGTIFLLGDEKTTLGESQPLILDPLKGHPREKKSIHEANMRETAKELAQLDGAFIISSSGVILSAARYINADSKGVGLPLGLGARHMAAAAVTRKSRAVAVVVSESAIVRVFFNGQMIAEIIPEIWMLGRQSIQIEGPYKESRIGDLQIFACKMPEE